MTLVAFIKHHAKLGFKYACVGSMGALVNLATQYLFTEFVGLWYIFSAVVGFLFGLLFNYFVNYYWTFKLSPRYDREEQLS